MFFNKKFNCLKKWYDFINEFENIRFNSKQIIDLIMARRQDTTLGELDFQAVQSEVNDACSSKRGQYTKFTDADRFDIGQYASENGPAATVRKFSKKFPTLNESTVRGLRKKYNEQVKMGTTDVPQVIVAKRRGRPLMLGDVLDKKIQEYIKVNLLLFRICTV